jgi:zinc transport system substrate-binding protein
LLKRGSPRATAGSLNTDACHALKLPGSPRRPGYPREERMKKGILCAVMLALLVQAVGCKKAGETGRGKIMVAVSVFPIYDIARNICGDRATVFYAVPAGADPHTFEPKPSIVRDLQNTSLFMGIEREFDGWMERYLPADARRKYLVGRTAAGTPSNPHIWLSVREGKKIAGAVARDLCALDPDNKEYYRKNLAAYDEKLNSLDKSMSELFRNKSGRSFIQWHEAWNYFAADYGLTISGTVQREGSDRSSVRSIKDIVDRARREKVTAIVVSLSSENKTAEVLAGEIGGSIVRLDGIGDPNVPERSDYLKLMYYNAKTLSGAMR